MQGIVEFLKSTGFYGLFEDGGWKYLVMICIACFLCYLAIVKKFEPLLLLPIAIGMLITNLPFAGAYHEELFAAGHIQWELFGGAEITAEKILEIAGQMGLMNGENILEILKNIAESVNSSVLNSLIGLEGKTLTADNILEIAGQMGLMNGEALYESIDALKDAMSAGYYPILDSLISLEGQKITAEKILEIAQMGLVSNEALLSALKSAVNVDSYPVLASLISLEGTSISVGLVDVLYLGVKLGVYPCLIFIGVGAMTDFGPLLANPKSLLLGAAAQIGIFATVAGVMGVSAIGEALGWEEIVFTLKEAASIGIIGGADGPTAIYTTSILAPSLLGPIAVAAYSYMALVPVIQPPIMKALTTKEERCIRMDALKPVSKAQKIIFPILVTIVVAFIVPSAAILVGCLMFGNLLKECGVCDRLSKTVQNELMNIVTVFLGVSVGATATASTFLSPKTLIIIVMGVVAFGVATASGVLIAKLMNVFLPEGKKINPLIGSAGVSAVPMAARVSQKVGQEDDPGNFLLMHAMGPNVAGVIGSGIAAGVLIALLGG